MKNSEGAEIESLKNEILRGNLNIQNILHVRNAKLKSINIQRLSLIVNTFFYVENTIARHHRG
jgi:hypothetical protein